MGDGGSGTARWRRLGTAKDEVVCSPGGGATYNAGRALGSVDIDTAAAAAGVVDARVHVCGRMRLGTLVWM